MPKEGEVFIQFASSCLSRGSSDWVEIAKINKAGKKIMVEAKLVRPDIVFCKVAQYLVEGGDKSDTVGVSFGGKIYEIPLGAIKSVVIKA